jgi:hypothetical protein
MSAPAIEEIEPTSANGIARRRLARPAFEQAGRGRERARERKQQPGAAHEIQVKRGRSCRR